MASHSRGRLPEAMGAVNSSQWLTKLSKKHPVAQSYHNIKDKSMWAVWAALGRFWWLPIMEEVVKVLEGASASGGFWEGSRKLQKIRNNKRRTTPKLIRRGSLSVILRALLAQLRQYMSWAL